MDTRTDARIDAGTVKNQNAFPPLCGGGRVRNKEFYLHSKSAMHFLSCIAIHKFCIAICIAIFFYIKLSLQTFFSLQEIFCEEPAPLCTIHSPSGSNSLIQFATVEALTGIGPFLCSAMLT